MNKKSKWLLALVLACFVISLSVWKATKGGGQKYRFTIGTTIKSDTSDYGRTVYYYYYVNNEQIKGAITLPRMDVKVPGGRYFVKYNARDKYMAELLKSHPVPDNISDVPADGWDKEPK